MSPDAPPSSQASRPATRPGARRPYQLLGARCPRDRLGYTCPGRRCPESPAAPRADSTHSRRGRGAAGRAGERRQPVLTRDDGAHNYLPRRAGSRPSAPLPPGDEWRATGSNQSPSRRGNFRNAALWEMARPPVGSAQTPGIRASECRFVSRLQW